MQYFPFHFICWRVVSYKPISSDTLFSPTSPENNAAVFEVVLFEDDLYPRRLFLAKKQPAARGEKIVSCQKHVALQGGAFLEAITSGVAKNGFVLKTTQQVFLKENLQTCFQQVFDSKSIFKFAPVVAMGDRIRVSFSFRDQGPSDLWYPTFFINAQVLHPNLT